MEVLNQPFQEHCLAVTPSRGTVYFPYRKEPMWHSRRASPTPMRSSQIDAFTPSFPARSDFWVGASNSRLVTVQGTEKQQAYSTPSSDDEASDNQETRQSLADNTSDWWKTVGDAIHESGIQEVENEPQGYAQDENVRTLQTYSDASSKFDMSATAAVDPTESHDTLPQERKSVIAVAGDMNSYEATMEEPGSYRLPDPANFKRLNNMADELPDYVHIPLGMAVHDEMLEGWEDEWFTHATFNAKQSGNLAEPKIDFVYTWVNGSDTRFAETMRPYEMNSSLNDDSGEWMASHGVNRYRDWDELRYSIRSVEKNAASFRNKVQILVNAVHMEDGSMTKQRPTWLKEESDLGPNLQVLSQENFFGVKEKDCLPTFNSLTIENQLYNTPSEIDRMFALSDDMFLAKPHSASDIYSPLFGTVMGFKQNGYNTLTPPSEKDALRFGEKPYLIYTSWLLNRRFGSRKRSGQVHFGHSLSRRVTKEAMEAFPRPSLKSACQKFRGETGFQLYSWYASFHYTIERQREALIWSYIMIRSDPDRNGFLDWKEREAIIKDLEEGIAKEGSPRKKMYYYVGKLLEDAGLEPPKVNVETTWTSLDGPAHIANIDCFEFNVNECLAPGFASGLWDQKSGNPVFSTAAIFDRVARQDPQCGDCLLKLILNRVEKGLSPLLPHRRKDHHHRKTVLKALKRYSYVVVEPDALFTMVTDAEQVQVRLIDRLADPNKQSGQLCLNDDVVTNDKSELLALKETMWRLFNSLWDKPSQFEI